MNEENRPLGRGPARILAGSSNNSSVPAPADKGHESAELIGHTVEKPLDATLWRLRTGTVGLEALTPALRGFCTLSHDDGYAAGFIAGVESTSAELRQAIADRDRYYGAAFNPRPPIKVGPSFAEIEKRRNTYAGVTE